MTALLNQPPGVSPRLESKRKVPRAALEFAYGPPVTMCDVGVQMGADGASAAAAATNDDAGSGSPPPPKAITILARTPGVAYQGYWGACVHNMDGFIPPTGPIPLDWDHNDGSTEDIGVAETFEIGDEGLTVTGRLIPFTATDRAAEIIYKGGRGVPYQASINMDLLTLVVTEVPEGVSYPVNGQDFIGPLVVFEQWGIAGIAILPYGADSDTSVQFKAGGDVDVTVKPFPSSERGGVSPLAKEPTMTEPAKPGDAVPATSPAAAPAALPAEAANFSRADALKFKTDFGAQGFEWYLEGKTYEEAAKLFGASKDARIAALEADLAAREATIKTVTTERDQFKAKAEFRRGHPGPVNTGLPADPNAKPGDEKPDPAHFGRSKGMSAFVRTIATKLNQMAQA